MHKHTAVLLITYFCWWPCTFYASAQNKLEDHDKCLLENSEFAKSYCYLSLAKTTKNKAICDKIQFLPDRYICYSELAAITNNTRICYEIPLSIENAKFNIKSHCYKKLLKNSCNKIADTKSHCSLQKDTDSIIQKLCKCGISPYSDDGIFSGTVKKCSDYYQVNYTDILDLPTFIVNDKGAIVAECGGMPLPNGEQGSSAECNLPCSDKDLCKNTIIDCRQFFEKKLPSLSGLTFEEELTHYQQELCDSYFGRTEKWYDELMATCNQINLSRQQP